MSAPRTAASREPPVLTVAERVEAWLAKREADGWFEGFAGLVRIDRAQQWRDVAAKYGAESGGARGCLLELVRLAWGYDRVHVMPMYANGRWAVFGDGMVSAPIMADTEIGALLEALEHRPVKR